MARIADRTLDAALVAGAAMSASLVIVTLPTGRPVTDDYGAIESWTKGLGPSLAWYYTEFQGNVLSWLFIMISQLPWLDGVRSWGSAASVTVTLLVLAYACWGALTFLGIAWPRRWRFAALLLVATVVTWLCLASVVSPNAMTLVFYIPSTIVHVWPWCFALAALGLVFRRQSLRGSLIWAGACGLMAGGLGFVEGLTIAAATVFVFVYRRSWRPRVQASGACGWVVGMSIGLGIQFASPATWSRGGAVGSEGALLTNIQAVKRLLAQGDALVGPSFGQWMLSALNVEDWARLLVPGAVAGDLLVRPGLVAVFLLAGWWVVRDAGRFTLARPDLKSRMVVLLVVCLFGGVAYSLSGALYAYAGRHVAGLAIIVSAMVFGLGVYAEPWWLRHQVAAFWGAWIAVAIVLLLGVQQAQYGLSRARAWDAAFAINRVLIEQGRLTELVDVPLKAGLSNSGLRDHDGSTSYVAWVLRQHQPD